MSVFSNITIYKPFHLIDVPEEINKEPPINYIKHCIHKVLLLPPNKRVILINASTGTGKTSFLPAEIFTDFDLMTKLNPFTVVCCVPKVLVAISVYDYIPKVFNKIKQNVNFGVSTGTYKSELGKPFMIMSTGTLCEIFKSIIKNHNNNDSQKLRDENNFRVIIIDEAHKHSLELDLLLALIKQYMNMPNVSERYKPILIIMSATLDYERYLEYFDLEYHNNKSTIDDDIIGGNDNNNIHNNFLSMSTLKGGAKKIIKENIHLIRVIGSVSKREDIYVMKKSENIIDMSFTKIIETVKDKDFIYGNILVFMPTKSYIKQLKNKLTNWVIDNKFPLLPISLTSDEINNNSVEYKRYKQEVDKIMMFNSEQKVIKLYICTNVAEEGTTFDNLRYVIDSGYQNTVQYNPHYFASTVIISPINLNSHIQRIGRTGRSVDGISISLFNKSALKKLSIADNSEFQNTDFSSQYLNLINSGIKFNELIYPPPNELLFSIEDKLFLLGFIDGQNNITELGKIANNLNIGNIELTKMILTGYAYNVCISDLITIAAVSNFAVKTNIYINDQFISGACRVYLYIFGRDISYNNVVLDKSFLKQNGFQIIDELDITRILDIRMRIIKEFQNSKISLGRNKSELYKFYEYELLERKIDNPDNHKDFLLTLAKYKRCIYEGFKNNLLIRESCSIEREIYYRDIRGNKIQVSNIYNQHSTQLAVNIGINSCFYPLYFITNRFTIRKDINSYVIEAGLLSAMDGFVNIDVDFITKYTKKIKASNIVFNESDLKLYYNLLPKTRYTFEHAVIKSDNPCIKYSRESKMNNRQFNSDKIGEFISIHES